MPRERKCRHCGKMFLYKNIQRGFIDSCDECSMDDNEPDTYAGQMNEKCEDIIIFRTDLPYVKDQIDRENALGPKPSIPLTPIPTDDAKTAERRRQRRRSK